MVIGHRKSEPTDDFKYIRRPGPGLKIAVDFVVAGGQWGKAVGATSARIVSRPGEFPHFSNTEKSLLKAIRDQHFPHAEIRAWVKGCWIRIE